MWIEYKKTFLVFVDEAQKNSELMDAVHMSFNKLSQDIGVAQRTIRDYYENMEDCLVIEKIEEPL